MSNISGFEVLEILALQGRDLPNKDYWKKQDPFLQYEIGSQFKRTKVDKKGGRNPEWNQRTRFERIKAPVTGNMKVKCYDDDLIGKPKFIGECLVNLEEVYTEGDMDNWFTLYDGGEKAGQIYLELTFYASDGVTRRRRVLDDERRALRKKSKGSRSGSEDSLSDEIDKLRISEEVPVTPIKIEPKPLPKVEPINAQASTSEPTTSIEEPNLPKPQAAIPPPPPPPQPAPIQPEPKPVSSQDQPPSTNSTNPITPSSNQNNLTNSTAHPPVTTLTDNVKSTPTSANQLNSNPPTVTNTNNAAPNTVPNSASDPATSIANQTKAPTEPVSQNPPNVSVSNISTNPVIDTNQSSKANIPHNSHPTVPNTQVDSSTSLPPQILNNQGAAPVLTSEPTEISAISNNVNTSSSIAHPINQPTNHHVPTNNINSENIQPVSTTAPHPASTTPNIGSKPSTYADNAASASPYPQINTQKPFTYGNIQLPSTSQSQSNPVSTHPNPNPNPNHQPQVQSTTVTHNANVLPSNQSMQEHVYNNLSQSTNHSTISEPSPVSQNHSISPVAVQTYPTNKAHIAQDTQPASIQAHVVSQPLNQQITSQPAQVSQNHPTQPTSAQTSPPHQAHTTQDIQPASTQAHVVSQPLNQQITPQATQVSQNHPTQPISIQTYPSSQAHTTQPISTQTSIASQPQQYSNHSYSNSYPSNNISQPSLPPSHHYPPQTYSSHSNPNAHTPPSAHQPYPPITSYYDTTPYTTPAPYPPPAQPYPPTSYPSYPSTHDSIHVPYPQIPQDTSPRPHFPSVSDHIYEQPYPPQFPSYHGRQDSYPPPPNPVSPIVNQGYHPYSPDPYPSYDTTSYHRPTSFPTFPSMNTSPYSDNHPSSPPPLPNKPSIPDSYVNNTPPPLPSRPSMAFPTLDTNNATSTPLSPVNSSQASTGIPYGAQSESDKKKKNSDIQKIKKMFKQFI